ncbi:MAG TPA: hypothetical protein VFW00_09180, partial [Rhodocyclaceae bacterium]|nr:hypothetical protein [Rhodocyclaceae bacterium]
MPNQRIRIAISGGMSKAGAQFTQVFATTHGTMPQSTAHFAAHTKRDLYILAALSLQTTCPIGRFFVGFSRRSWVAAYNKYKAPKHRQYETDKTKAARQ